MLALIEQKVEGQEITVAPRGARHKIIDLMEALKASLAASGKGGSGRKPAQSAQPAEKKPAKAKAPPKKRAAK